ncbi:MAG: type II toxin-antitoxin system Phd/YefM family antitoxin [Desulfuromonadales bacterium]|nr:type II toxin-antitoxin system Phd/YefM family antitoxin [Chloroflexota bacterium]MCK4622184.1 type II toxin-antitoxin system Phd/YefM family antitoxin [Desulfuromonadales bacterium]
MGVKFSEDIVPLTAIKINPGRIVRRTKESHRPILLTSRGRGVAVMQSLEDFEQAEEEKAFMRAVVEGLSDLENNREVDFEATQKRLGLT